MKNELDRKIREALRAEDAEIFGDLVEEPSVFDMLTETMRGRHRWLNLLGGFWILVFLILAVVAAFRFFDAATDRDMLMWAAVCILCMSAVSMLKVWYWMELQKNAMIREVKRLELQIARLVSRLNQR